MKVRTTFWPGEAEEIAMYDMLDGIRTPHASLFARAQDVLHRVQ
jgi:hypothetical protein